MFSRFFQSDEGQEGHGVVYFVLSSQELGHAQSQTMSWLLQASPFMGTQILGEFIGPRRELVTPWSSNAVDIAHNVGLLEVTRIEQFRQRHSLESFDPMLESLYDGINLDSLNIEAKPKEVFEVEDISAFNEREGLALSEDEIEFLLRQQELMGRRLTDCELFGFAQINSEHCRHKIFNGQFILDGKPCTRSLFEMIKSTSRQAPAQIVSAYRDNVAFLRGTEVLQFAPKLKNGVYCYAYRNTPVVFSLKAETHNFPTTVEPFFGASTGSGGEIRDRMAGGRGSFPLAGTAVYMTSYTRLNKDKLSPAETTIEPRSWKYQSPQEILTKASNGASDFGNKFGQPLIAGSVLTFEGEARDSKTGENLTYAYDRAVMLAGGVGYALAKHAEKSVAEKGDKLLLLGGDNYRIGMGGGSVSSVATGKYSTAIELSAVQRANPEMQKRVYNVVRALAEGSSNPIKLIHDHGAGGHINCFSELFDPMGGEVDISKLPIGDPTLSVREIIANESQERMGLIVGAESVSEVAALAARERAPMYVVGEVTGDERLVFRSADGSTPVNVPLKTLFGDPPTTVLTDLSSKLEFAEPKIAINNGQELLQYLELVLGLEAVACKDYLTNKVDRCVSGRVAMQQCTGPRHLPLNDAGIMALDYQGKYGVATAIGHASIVGLIDEAVGSRLSVAEALTNLVFTPLSLGLKGAALSANWMWPAGNSGENSRLYRAVQALSDFCIELGLSVPTGKDSLSMTMRYADGTKVLAPGTVIVSSAALVQDVLGAASAELKAVSGSRLVYINFSGSSENSLGGSSFLQSLGYLGNKPPQIKDAASFAQAFGFVQEVLIAGDILACHDISAGGLITAAIEMAIVGDVGLSLALDKSQEDLVSFLFCEKPGVLLQLREEVLATVMERARQIGLDCLEIGLVLPHSRDFALEAGDLSFKASLDRLLRGWMQKSVELDRFQTAPGYAESRLETLANHKLQYRFPDGFDGRASLYGVDFNRSQESSLVAAVVREQGTNGEREMAIGLHGAGFDVLDVTMEDLSSGSVTLDDVRFLVFPGGFANGDVLGAGRGWAGVFKYNKKARIQLEQFYSRKDTLSLGVCNGCQLMISLGLIEPIGDASAQMMRNKSQKFESGFVAVDIEESPSIMLKTLVGSRLGIWVAHGEGRFSFSGGAKSFHIPIKYACSEYPYNPNGADECAAGVCSPDGRHLAMMPHLERSIFPWQWPWAGSAGEVKRFTITPWELAFINARQWLLGYS